MKIIYLTLFLKLFWLPPKNLKKSNLKKEEDNTWYLKSIQQKLPKVCLVPSQTSLIKLLCKNSCIFLAVNYLTKSSIADVCRVQNTSLLFLSESSPITSILALLQKQ